ncbi:MAG TPA: hypothetical protein VFW23_13025 [Tepidisphaeraceae bacterium]|nr:hypothetical protein [Tepidisphaeraceae bacterium]
MPYRLRSVYTALFFVVALAPVAIADGVHHYVFIGGDREKLTEAGFLDSKGVEGVQVKYTWKQLEQGKDNYVFDDVRSDLTRVKSKGKKLFIQVQDSNFALEYDPVPKYLERDPAYHGGVAFQVGPEGKPEQAKPYGHVARRWDPSVRERFHKLLFALGKEFDGRIEGINLPETAIDVPAAGPNVPSGYTPEVYRDALLDTMAAMKKAFPKSTVMMYANFMPEQTGEPVLLRSLYENAAKLGVAMGGPDLLPNRKWQLLNSYPLIHQFSERIPMGIAVQDGNLADIDPKTHNVVTVRELTEFATDYLHVKYIFWGTQEPYFTRDVLPFLATQ